MDIKQLLSLGAPKPPTSSAYQYPFETPTKYETYYWLNEISVAKCDYFVACI